MSHQATSPRRWPGRRAIWRWHFYAGLFCIPFVIWLATTGSIYLFKPQIEAWLDRDYDSRPFDGARAAPSRQVHAALAALPGATFAAYELPPTPEAAARVQLRYQGERYRVLLDPGSAAVLRVQAEDERSMRVLSSLHGSLRAGTPGSLLVELAASWAIVMIVSGLVLWWPRQATGLGGVVYPRLSRGDAGGRRFWRDLHGVIGFWVSALALFLLLTGLPWTTVWGGGLSALRSAADRLAPTPDWVIGAVDPHAAHRAEAGIVDVADADPLPALDRVVAAVEPLQLPAPVLVAPPKAAEPRVWSVRAEPQNRPRRVTLSVAGDSGLILSRQDFAQRPLIDRIVGTGVAAHEGQLFGAWNQALGVFTALSLILLCVSAVAMWWKRRPAQQLGAPAPIDDGPLPASFVALLVGLGLLLPMLGLSLVAVLLTERTVLRRWPAARRFVGLAAVSNSKNI